MRKIVVFLVFVIGIGWGFSQQNSFFKEVKEIYDKYENDFKQEFDKRYSFLSNEQKHLIEAEYVEILSKIKETRNRAYLEALIKTKVALDLERIRGSQNPKQEKSQHRRMQVDREAEYPTGVAGFRAEIIELFNTDAINSGEGVLSTMITFVVEKDGTISDVKSEGEHIGFNRQAEIAIYLLSYRFKPAVKNGKEVRIAYKFPIKMRFE